MAYESRQLSIIIARAAQHLHSVLRGIGTALIDTQAKRMLFNNSVLNHIQGHVIARLAREYAEIGSENAPCLYTHTEGDFCVYLVVLDERHVLTIAGSQKDETVVQEFVERLQILLAGVRQTQEDDEAHSGS